MSKQPLRAKVGEVQFRAEVTGQHLGKERQFEHEYTKSEMKAVMREKIERIKKDFTTLKNRATPLSSFLEIGSGYGQASLILVNKFNAVGFATDIAVDPLRGVKETAKKFKFRKFPEIVVCDAESLPFHDNSFPFVFCYQTLHHFPHPGKVIREVYRVLAPGGYFFFAEEPVAQTFNIPLWRRPTKLRWWEKFLKATCILLFISRIGKTETDHGILEETFPLKVWKQSLSSFEEVEAKLFPFPFGPTGLLLRKNYKWQRFNLVDKISLGIIFFVGGGISGTARKEGTAHKLVALPSFICISCNKHPKLVQRDGQLVCPACKVKYLKKDGIDILLSKKLREKLYP
ncbi:methyltransferase domain-containing protein [Candidatus Microgenomates bacterium]|nr:methyltransferase domain-containing protein [Candidatus Microgenomates bacterium]